MFNPASMEQAIKMYTHEWNKEKIEAFKQDQKKIGIGVAIRNLKLNLEESVTQRRKRLREIRLRNKKFKSIPQIARASETVVT